MQVKDVLDKLAEMFPRHAQVLHARLGVYKTALTPLAGDRLTRAYERTMAGWSKESPPWPKDIADNAPGVSSGGSNRVDQTEQAMALQHKLIADTLNLLSFEIAAVAKDHGVEFREIEGSLDWRWRKPAWKLACDHVRFGTALPNRMSVADGELEALARGIQNAGSGYKRVGSFKPLRPPALEQDVAPERAAAFEAAEG